jgi:hypothetical protein
MPLGYEIFAGNRHDSTTVEEIVGAMMLMVGFESMKFASSLRLNRQLATVIVTVTGSLMWNMAAGFLVGMVVHYILLHKGKPQ